MCQHDENGEGVGNGRSSPYAILMPALLSTAGLSAQPADVHRDAGIRWAPSSVAPSLTIGGLVFDAETGESLPGTQVFLEGQAVGAVAGIDGRFELAVPGPGSYELAVALIGYGAVSDSVEVGEESGVLAQVGLLQRSLGCIYDCFGPCPSGVRIVVRDLGTGQAPTGLVELRVRSGTFADSAQARARTPEEPLELHAGGGLGLDGPFDVEVFSPGYSIWRASDVWLESTGCLPRVSPWLDVWLIPH